MRSRYTINRTLPYQIIFTIIFLCLSTRSWAEESKSSLVRLPSVIDYTKGNGWSGGVGAKLEYSAIYKGSDHYILEAKVDGAIQWRTGNHILFWEGFDLNHTELGWRGLFENDWLVEAGIRHEIVIPSSRSEEAGINGLPHRGSQVFGFVEIKRSINNNWENWISGRLSSGSSNYGELAKLSIGHNFGVELDNTGMELIVFSTFGSKNNINNYFGISEADSSESGLDQIDLDGGYRSTGLNLVYRKNILTNIQLSARTGIEFYSSDIKKSDLVRDSSEIGADISVIWMY